MRRRFVLVLIIAFVATALDARRPASAWGDEGHQIVGLIAERFLSPAARREVNALLAADTDDLTAHTIDDAATWADRYRDQGPSDARQATRQWHFVDIEIRAPDIDKACHGHPKLPPGTLASNGPAEDCVVDKIDQFAAELAARDTPPEERIVALKFLLHLVGDEHQPLHASDDNDRGGNKRRASASGLRPGTLHRYWDTEFVEMLGSSPKQTAGVLINRISPSAAAAWSRGTPTDWALESFRMAKDDVYGKLPPPNRRGSFRLGDDYVTMATNDVALQLSKAGVRLATLLNGILGR